MTTNLTTRELFDAAREIGPHIDALNSIYENAVHRHREAKSDWEDAKYALSLAEAKAFREASETGAASELAKRMALLDPNVQELQKEVLKRRRVMDQADADAEAARVGSSRWQSLLDTYTSVSHTLNRELRSFASVGGDGY